MKALFEKIKTETEQGRAAVLCSVVASHGSTPRGQGARMAVLSDGSTIGTVGGGAVEYRATLLASEVLKTGQSLIRSFALHKDEIADIGMVCGGDVLISLQVLSSTAKADEILTALDADRDSFLVTEVEDGQVKKFYATETPPAAETGRIYVEPLKKSGRVWVFGGGHVSRALVPVLSFVQFQVSVLEDREQFARKELFPSASEVLLIDFRDLSALRFTERDYIVIMTRGHQSDFDVLRQVLKTPATYIGCIGSRSKVAFTRQRLRELGFTDSDFERVNSPIGLPIGGETPEEIAVSIAAQMIRHRASNKSSAIL